MSGLPQFNRFNNKFFSFFFKNLKSKNKLHLNQLHRKLDKPFLHFLPTDFPEEPFFFGRLFAKAPELRLFAAPGTECRESGSGSGRF